MVGDRHHSGSFTDPLLDMVAFGTLVERVTVPNNYPERKLESPDPPGLSRLIVTSAVK